MSTTARADPGALRAFGDGRVVAAAAGVLLVALVVAGRLSVPAFVLVSLVALAFAAYAAHRWPMATLVVAAIATLADTRIAPRIAPEGLTLGPIGFSEPLLAVTAAIIAVDALRRGMFVAALRDPVFVLLGVFVAVSLVSGIVNLNPPLVTFLGIAMTIDAIAVFFLARMLPHRTSVAPHAIAALVGGALIAAGFGIAQVVLDPNLLGFFSFEGRFGEGGRITSFLGNPNMVAAVIGMTLPFPLFASVRLERPGHRWMARAALFVLLLALLLTFSRGAWLSVTLGIVIGTLLLDWRALLTLVIALVLAWGTATVVPRNLAVVPGDGTAEPTAPPVIPDVIDSTVDRFDDLTGESDLRVRFIRDGLPILLDHPLLGVGPGRYGGAVASIFPSPVYPEYDTELFRYRTVHNFWLHLLGEVGAIGTAAFLAMLAVLLVRYVRAARRTTGTAFVVVAGAATALIISVFNNLTEMIYEGNLPAIYLWLILGIASLLAPARPWRRGNTGPRGRAEGAA